MCDTCGCNITPGNQYLIKEGGKLSLASNGKTSISVLKNLMHENDHIAAHNRDHFDKHNVLVINLMSSPGSGKTALLETTIQQLKKQFCIAVIEGDLETEKDAERIRKQGVPAIQITTGSACHLDAHMVHDALHNLSLADLDIVFIENVGNLVCPASFDLGQHLNVTLLSVTEGDDKPSKYPVMFRAAGLMLLTKTDLLDVLDDFDTSKAEHNLRQLASRAPVFELSARRGEGITNWLDWLSRQFDAQIDRVKKGESLKPAIQPNGTQLHTQGLHAHDQHASVHPQG
jgi:hydrogenase nickel incorporation protein HypB